MTKIILLLLIFCHDVQAQTIPCPTKVRGSIDMGSGTTKVVVAKIRLCPGKPIEIVGEPLFSETLPFSLQSLLKEKDKEWAFSYVGLRDYVSKFESMLAKLKDLKVDDWACGATAAVRTATNRNEFLKNVMNATGVLCQVVEQDHEGRLSYEGVAANPNHQCKSDPRPLMVWDIGGGSGQLTFKSSSQAEPIVGRYIFGAESFRNELVKAFPPPTYRCAGELSDARKNSPNPIGQKNLSEAIRSASIKGPSAWAGKSPPNFKNYCFVGVGGVHNYAIQTTLSDLKIFNKLKNSEHPDCSVYKNLISPPTDSYTYKQLSCLVHFLADKTDCELKDIFPSTNRDFASTNVSNMILVLGLMKSMGFSEDEKIYIQKVDLNYELLKSKNMSTSPQPIKNWPNKLKPVGR